MLLHLFRTDLVNLSLCKGELTSFISAITFRPI